MPLTIDQLKIKYGYVTTWTDGQASGTDFSRSHKPEIVDRLKRGIEGACKRQRIVGPGRVAIMGQPRRDVSWFTEYGPMWRTGGFGTVLNPNAVRGDFWDNALTDALWDAVVVIDQTYPTPEVRFELKALRLPTVADMVEFLDNFVTDGVYTAHVTLEGYWLEDETLPSLPKVNSWNAAFGALSAGRRRLSTPNPEAFLNDPNPTRLREFLEWVWTTVAGYGPVPGGWSDEEFFKCFWMHTLSRKANRYGAANNIKWDHLDRNVEDGAGNITQWASSMYGHGLMKLIPISRAADGQWGWSTESVRGYTAQQAEPMYCVLAIGLLQSKDPDPPVRAIAIHPIGITTLMLPWRDPALYEVQSVQEPLCGSPQRIRVVEDAFGSGSFGVFRGTPISMLKWAHPGTGSVKDGSVPETKFRLRLRGTPYVGPLSPWAVKSLLNKNRRYDGFYVE